MNTLRARSAFWKVFAAISAIALLATASTIGLLYRTAYREQARDLERAANTLAALMESVAQFDLKFSAHTHPDGSRGATLSQIAQGMTGIAGQRGNGELVIGRRNGDFLQVLRAAPGGDFAVVAELKFDGQRGRPLFEALAGRSGSGEFRDYRGERVLAAYAPVPALEIGLVYKADLVAMRAPFLRAGAWAAGVYLLLVGLLAAGYWRVAGKLERRLQASEARFASAFHGNQTAMGIRRLRDDVAIEANASLLRLLGRRREEVVGRKVGELGLYFGADGRKDILARTIRREPVENIEVQFRDHAGGVRHGLMSVNYLEIDGEDCALASFTDVSARHHAEAAQRDGERRLRSILDSSEDRIFLLDREGLILAHNAATAEAYGPDLNGKNVFTLGPAAVAAERQARFAQAVATGAPARYEDTLGERHADVVVTPVRDETGNVTTVVVVSHDITERKWAENALRASEGRYRQIFETAREGIWVIDENNVTTLANPRMAEILGCSVPEMMGTSLFDHMDDAGRALAAAAVERRRNGIAEEQEFVFRRKDGAKVWTSIVTNPLTDEQGRYRGAQAIVTDITARRAAEAALRDSEARYRRAERGTNDGLWEWNIATGEDYFSPRWLEMLGYAPGELPYRQETFADLIHPDDQAPLWAAVERHLKDGVPFDLDARLRCKSGDYLWVRSRGEAERDTSGKPFRMAGSITDISENKRAAAALQHERDRLRQILDTYFGFVAVFTPAGAITEVNQTPLTLMGLTRADVLGRLFWDVGWLETGETVPQVQAMIAAAARGEMSRGDILARFPGVGVRDVEVVFSPLRDAAGQVVSVISFGVDITERKQAELRQARHVDRLKQLSELSLMLSGDPGVVFERVVRLIGELFAVKVVCLSEIAGKELLFRAVYVEGQVFANAGGCPLEITPCATVEQHKEIQVYDRVAELFPQAAFLREHRAHAYCGFPALDNAGRVVAVTCLLDDQPHEFTEEDQHLLRIIGQRLATEVERGKIVAERTKTDQALHASETRLNEAQRIARVGGWELDLVTGRLHWSDEIFRLFELDPAQFGATYEAFLHAVHPDDRDAVNAAYTGSLRDRKPYRIVHRLRMADGRIKHVEEQCETDFAPDGTPLESRGTVQDVTGRVLAERALQASLREKTTLLQEIHHRVKNNLQVVSSLLFFEQRRAAHPAVAAQFQRSHDRVAAISLVHERLYQAPDLVGINFAPYVETLGQHVLRGFSGQAGPVALRVEGAGFKLGVTEAVPCALIVNELLANSLKHAFPAGRAGTVTIRLEADAAGARHLWFGDDGAGLPGDVLPAGGRSLGLRLVEQLTEQLQATFVREPAVQGLRFHLTIPAVNPP